MAKRKRLPKIRDRIKELRRVKASELVPHPQNWRQHPQGQRDALSAVLTEIGYADTLLTRELPDGRLGLVDGHLRQDLADDDEVPCLVTDLTEDEARVILATLDPLAAMAEADAEALGGLLGDIETENEDLDKMLAGLATEHEITMSGEVIEDPGPRVDQADELQKKWDTQVGQVWGIGRHAVYCGDCFDWPQKADGVLTDPPYDLSVDTLRAAFGRYSKVAAVLCGGRQAFTLARDGWDYAADFVWVHGKPRSKTFNQPIYYHANVVVIAFGGVKTGWRRPYPAYGSRIEGAYEDSKGHGQGKSPDIFQYILEGFPWKTVADPFAGTLSTLVATHRRGLRFMGAEISPKLLAVGLERVELLRPKVLTGKDLACYNIGMGAGGQRPCPEHPRTEEESEHV